MRLIAILSLLLTTVLATPVQTSLPDGSALSQEELELFRELKTQIKPLGEAILPRHGSEPEPVKREVTEIPGFYNAALLAAATEAAS